MKLFISTANLIFTFRLRKVRWLGRGSERCNTTASALEGGGEGGGVFPISWSTLASSDQLVNCELVNWSTPQYHGGPGRRMVIIVIIWMTLMTMHVIVIVVVDHDIEEGALHYHGQLWFGPFVDIMIFLWPIIRVIPIIKTIVTVIVIVPWPIVTVIIWRMMVILVILMKSWSKFALPDLWYIFSRGINFMKQWVFIFSFLDSGVYALYNTSDFHVGRRLWEA